MKHISSRDNPQYKMLSRLMAGKRESKVVLEGIHVCQEWLRHQGQPVFALFDLHKLDHEPELQQLADRLASGVAASCEPALIRRLSAVEQGQGVLFVCRVPEPQAPARIRASSLWVDRIQDPGNLGTLLRTAAAAGLDSVYLSVGTTSAWSQKVLRSAQGAHFSLSIYEHVDLLAAAHRLEIPLIATALDDSAESLHDATLPRHCAWVVGNEGQGVSPKLLARADRRIYIPQAPGVESLNVAVAAAICMFEQRRQHKLPLGRA